MSSTEDRESAPFAPHSLRGLVVAVTRPPAQAESTCAALEAAGAEVIRFPVMDIVPVTSSPQLDALAACVPTFDVAVFISANAVRYGLQWLQPLGGLPAGCSVAAVGRATARALTDAGVSVHIAPAAGFNSEALLAHPALQQLQDRQVVLFRGVGGRELLADSMRARGAKVHYAEVYRREPAPTDIRVLARHWQQQRLHLIVVTSGDGLQFLLQRAGSDHRQQLLATPLAVIGERMLQQARTMGFQSDIIVTEPGEQALVAALQDWHQTANRE